jgi:hypothetical protein
MLPFYFCLAAVLLTALSFGLYQLGRDHPVGKDAPTWTDQATAIGTIATAIILALTAAFALGALADAKRTRHAQIVTDLSRRWDERLTTASRERAGDYDSKALLDLVDRVYDPPKSATAEQRKQDVDEFFLLGRWLNVIETIAALHADKSLDGDLIFMLWGNWIAAAWTEWELAVNRMRQLERRPGIFRNFQVLAQEMRQRLADEIRGERSAASG